MTGLKGRISEKSKTYQMLLWVSSSSKYMHEIVSDQVEFCLQHCALHRVTSMCEKRLHAWVCMCIHVCVYIYLYMCVCMCACTFVCAHICVCVCARACVGM